MADLVPPNYSTPLGQVRLLLGDDDSPYVFSDEKIQAMLVIYSDNIQLTAADFFDRIAMDSVLLYKVVRTDDLQVDGVAMAKFFRERAKALRDEAAEDALNDAFQLVYPWGRLSEWDTIEPHYAEGVGYRSWGS